MEDHEYVTITEAAHLLSVTTKTVQRWIHSGKLPASYPHKNLAQIAMRDVYPLLPDQAVTQETDETTNQLLILTQRLERLEQDRDIMSGQIATLQERIEQLAQPAAAATLPVGVSLRDFATQHAINRDEAFNRCNRGMIAASEKVIRRNKTVDVMIDAKGKRDFWIQFHNEPSFRACDDCPHA